MILSLKLNAVVILRVKYFHKLIAVITYGGCEWCRKYVQSGEIYTLFVADKLSLVTTRHAPCWITPFDINKRDLMLQR